MIEILERSYNPYSDTTLTTLVAEYPRIIHAELLTHRVLSRNSASSRAIPSLSMTELVLNKPFIPEQWFKNAKGMSPVELLDVESVEECKKIWMELIEFTAAKVKRLTELQLHKSYANRPLEPYSYIKVIISGTEWNNFYNLRCSRPAQEEFIKLANAIKEAQEDYAPIALKEGQWHLPFIKSVENSKGIVEYYDNTGNKLSLEEAKIVSASCCAQISYRKEDSTIEKARSVFKQLIESDPKHCFTEGTQVLTIEGFKNFKNITEEDKIASVDINTLEFIGWCNPINIISRPLEPQEKLYLYPHIGLEVTEKHNMIGSIVSNSHSRTIYTHGIYKPMDKPSSSKGTKSSKGEQEALLPKSCSFNENIDSKDYVFGQLLGFYIGDGFTNWKKPTFRLVKERKIEYIIKILDKLDIEYNIYNRENDITSVGNQVTEIKIKTDINFIILCGENSSSKKIPDIAYNNLDMINGIFDGLKNSDGSIKRNTWTYCTKSEKLKDQIISLAPLIGLSFIENKMQYGNYKLMQQTRKYHRINDSRSTDSKAVIHNNYKGNIYCVEVPGNAIIVKTKDNQILVSGNCSPVEHQATPIVDTSYEGITHIDKYGNKWSGNLKGWLQWRQLL